MKKCNSCRKKSIQQKQETSNKPEHKHKIVSIFNKKNKNVTKNNTL